MTKRLRRQRCRSSKTREARWRKVSLTSSRTFHFIPCSACSRMHAVTLHLIKRIHSVIRHAAAHHTSALLLFVMLLLCLLPPVFCCRYYRPKPREAPHARPSTPSTASTPCSPTETRTSPRSLRSVPSLVSFPFCKSQKRKGALKSLQPRPTQPCCVSSASAQRPGPRQPGAAHHSSDHPGSPGPAGPRTVRRTSQISCRQLHCEGFAHERQGTRVTSTSTFIQFCCDIVSVVM